MNNIYLDNAATTKVDPEVVEAMLPYFTNYYGNASEPHSWGIKANEAVESSREKIAKFLGADKEEIIFTSCSTESINLAHKGLIETSHLRKPHIITTPIEHKAVLEACKHTKAEITYLPVDQFGLVKVSDIRNAIKPNTILVSVMYANNEIGTIEPIREIGEMLRKVNSRRKRHIYFHTDATQAIQYLEHDVDYLGVDLLSFTGHKIHAPKGIGCLYIREGTPISRQQDGGSQEFSLRAGTENVPYIVGLAKAIDLIKRTNITRIRRLADRFIDNVVMDIPQVMLTGDVFERVPHIVSFAFGDIRNDQLLEILSDKGIACATGSACTATSLEPSHVLQAIGVPDDYIEGSIRFSLSKYTTEKELLVVEKELKKAITLLRQHI